MKIYISGGCKNGKSTLAQMCASALADGGPLYYLATMIPHDEEDRERIRRHIKSREGKGFTTIEEGYDILNGLDEADAEGTFLVDSVTALVSNKMFGGGEIVRDAGVRAAGELCEFAKRVKNVIFVSDYIFSDDRRYDEYTEEYRKNLAYCDKTLAALCDTVAEVCVGHYTLYKGQLPLQEI